MYSICMLPLSNAFSHFKLIQEPLTLVVAEATPCFEIAYIQTLTEDFCELLLEGFNLFERQNADNNSLRSSKIKLLPPIDNSLAVKI